MTKGEWFDIDLKVPPVGAEIMAELDGCKIADVIWMEVREGEGLGHIKRWKFTDPRQKDCWDSSVGQST